MPAVTSDKIHVDGKINLKKNKSFRNATYHYVAYVADMNGLFKFWTGFPESK